MQRQMRGLNLDRKRRGVETQKQDISVNTSVISESRRKCLNCSFVLCFLTSRKLEGLRLRRPLLIFPISYHDKSCSDIQQAEMREHFECAEVCCALRSWKERHEGCRNKPAD